MNLITPSYLQEKGFKFSNPSSGGADQWLGYPVWKKDDFRLRGFVSTAKGGKLHLEGYFNSKIVYQEDLESLYRMLTGSKL